MIWISLYFLIGVFAILLVSRRHEKMGVAPSGIMAFDIWLFPLGVLLWPLVILLANADAKGQLEAKHEEERLAIQRDKERPEDLSPLVGSAGMALSQLAPHGRIKIGAWQFEAVSESGYLPEESAIRVVGIGPFRELRVVKAEPGSGLNEMGSRPSRESPRR